jgi:hypothetical protein
MKQYLVKAGPTEEMAALGDHRIPCGIEADIAIELFPSAAFRQDR